MKGFIAGLAFGLAIAVVAVWIAQGKHSGTLEEEPVRVTVVDPDCKDEDGDFKDGAEADDCIEENKLQMVKVYKIGLMDFVLPAAGGLSGVGAFFIFLAARGRREDVARDPA